MMKNWAAHEFLETTELLRKLTADIELHAFFAQMTADQAMKNMLERHIQMMDTTYRQAISLLQNKGMHISSTSGYRQINMQFQPQLGYHNPQMILAPNMNATRISDATIGTVVLNAHKAGSALGMLWAGECVDPDVRSLHIMCANNCQHMAYEVFQLMNERGFYEVPVMPQEDVRHATSIFQSASNPNMTNINSQPYA